MQATGAGLLLIGVACGGLILAACVPVAAGRRRARLGMPGIWRRTPRGFPALLGPAAGGALAIVAASLVLQSHAPRSSAPAALFAVLPGLRVEAAATPLAAVFWLLIGVPLLAMGLFAVGARPAAAKAPARAAGGLDRGVGFPAASAALPAVFLALVTVADGLSFVILWQAAALIGMLVTGTTAAGRGRRRGHLITGAVSWPAALQASGACLLAALLLFDSGCGTLQFAGLRACGPHLEPARQSAIFILTLLACGSAALVPLVSSRTDAERPGMYGMGELLLRTLAPRVALYPLLLVPFTLLGPGPAWWGVLLMAIGAVAAPTGAARAIAARSTPAIVRDGGIVQVGVVLLCLGAALLPRSSGLGEGMAPAAALLCAAAGTSAATLLGLAAWTREEATERGDTAQIGGADYAGLWTRLPLLIGLAGTLVLPALGSAGGGWLAIQAALAVAVGPGQGPFVGGLAACGAALLGLIATLGVAAATLALGRAAASLPAGSGPQGMAGQMPVVRWLALFLAALPVLMAALVPSSAVALLRPAVQDLGGRRAVASAGSGPLDSVGALAMHVHLSALGLFACLAGYTAACALGARLLAGRSGLAAGAQPAAAHVTGGIPRMGMPAPSGGLDAAVLTAAMVLRRLRAPYSRIAAYVRGQAAGWALPRVRGRTRAARRGRGRRVAPALAMRLAGAVGGAASLLSLAALLAALLVLAR